MRLTATCCQASGGERFALPRPESFVASRSNVLLLLLSHTALCSGEVPS